MKNGGPMWFQHQENNTWETHVW